jgi:hypothetical protein
MFDNGRFYPSSLPARNFIPREVKACIQIGKLARPTTQANNNMGT